MKKPERVNIGDASFGCPNCNREYTMVLWEEADDDLGDGLVSSEVVECKCGATFFCADDLDDFHVYWINRREFDLLRLKLWLKTKPHIRPLNGGYYDLVRVPHGHIPSGKVRVWGRFPLLVREIRDDKFFRCPECGHGSFFKLEKWCRCCEVQDARAVWDAMYMRAQNRLRRTYFRNLLKRLEVMVLPLLVLFGEAWYVHSERMHRRDNFNKKFRGRRETLAKQHKNDVRGKC